MQYQIAIVPRYGSVHGAGNRRANEPVPQRCAALAIGVEGVNAIVLRRDENNVVRTAGYAHLRHEQRLPIDERIDTTGEHLSEQRGINVRRRQLSFVQIGAGALHVVLIREYRSAAYRNGYGFL